MPLTMELKPNDKIIVNGAVIENAGAATRLILHNQAAVLRGKEIMTEEEANTPAKRIYFALQGAYIFPEKQEETLIAFAEYLGEFLRASPSSVDIIENIRKTAIDGKIYQALRKIHDLIEHEEKIMEASGIKLNYK